MSFKWSVFGRYTIEGTIYETVYTENEDEFDDGVPRKTPEDTPVFDTRYVSMAMQLLLSCRTVHAEVQSLLAQSTSIEFGWNMCRKSSIPETLRHAFFPNT